jgi:hypothetical protein
MKLDEAEIASEVREIEDSLKVRQNGFELFKINQNFRRAVTILRSSNYAVFALLVFIIGFAMSAGPIIWVLCSEIYPLSGRDFGVTCSTATNWIVNALVGMSFLTLIHTFGPGNAFLLYGGTNVLFIIFFVLFVPETKGVSLEKIERNLMSGLPLRKIRR